MKIVIEGCDGTGKTSVAKILAEKYGCDIVHMTGNDPRDYQFYYQSLRKEQVVYDRNVLGEFVYPYVFGRQKEVRYGKLNRLMYFCRNNGVYFFVLTANRETCKLRLIEKDEDIRIIRNIDYILAKFRALAFEYDIPEIDTTLSTAEETAKEIMNIIERKGE